MSPAIQPDQIERVLAKMFLRLGAIRSEVTREGVSTHWPTDKLADIASWKLLEMGLTHVEKRREAGLFGVFAKFPLDGFHCGIQMSFPA